MKIRNIILGLIILGCISCKKKNDSKINQIGAVKNETAIKNESFLNILIEQVKSGASEEYSSYENYGEKDLNALVIIEDSILKSNGFKAIETIKFNEKIKKIFNRIIDNNSENKYLKIDTYKDNICDKSLLFYPRSAEYQNIYISKINKFITYFHPLPQIIDYVNLYPELSKYEEKPFTIETMEGKMDITRWKDIPNLKDQRKKNIQTLVARNMYLFNDSRAHLKWLILNDEYFMQSLVTSFGYYEDKELLKWVIENTTFDSRKPEELDEIFWSKRCDGTIKLNTEIYAALKEIITPKDNKYFEALKEYVNYLIIDNDKKNELSNNDRANLLAHLVYFGEQYRYDEKYKDQSFFMQRIEQLDLGHSLKKEIEKNNFYGLPNYKQLYIKSSVYQDELVQELM
ncbi:hypothetical protein ASF10_20055 [Flavobacterium sp. Leaf82]|uniref:hypothetical protein n=1 Tax=unclassified Flavobacterium TaxID=196869 RepID=UPI0006F98290|nr:hypothetical protein [Flavobacterium sp. Leaf82]KQO32753.1 hypothetical protein ASF10_20055 [Flavobacterium sp. Leaf82]